MAIIEIVFPKLKRDPEAIKVAEKDVIPVIVKEFKAASVLDGLRGWIESEDGRDVTSEFREVLVLQWPNTAAFHTFVESAGYANVKSMLKPLAEGPPTLKLFEASDASNFFSADPVLEILEIRPKTGSVQGDDVEDVLKKIQSTVANTNPKVLYGSSLNLDQKQAVVTRLFASHSDLATEATGASRRELLVSLGELAEVTQLVAKVDRMPL